jgi:predicted secreted Zn-dependent protease
MAVSIFVTTLLLSWDPAAASASVGPASVEHVSSPMATTVGAGAQRIVRDDVRTDAATRSEDALPPREAGTPQVPATPAIVAPATPALTVRAVTAPARPATVVAPSIRLVALPSLTVDVSKAQERYYSVGGRTPALILASARKNVPSDPSGNDRDSIAYVGPVVWKHVPTYAMNQTTGACTMTGVTSSTRYQATLPRWASPSKVPPQLLGWWKTVLRHVQAHESGHVRIFEAYVRALPSRIVGRPCAEWQAKVAAWSAELSRAQARYDAAEARWVFPTYTGPTNW